MKEEGAKDIRILISQMQKMLPVVKSSLDKTEDKLQVIHSVTDKIEESLRHLSACIKAVDTLEKVSKAMSAIPVIGTVANALSMVLKNIEKSLGAIQKTLCSLKDVVNKVDNVAFMAENGLLTAIDIDDRLAEILPKVDKTLRVLDYLLQIADCILPVVAGTSLQDALDKIRKRIDDIERSAMSPVNDIKRSLDNLGSTLDEITLLCDRIDDKTKGLREVIDKLKTVAGVLSPIGDVFQKVINAIAPIKWVLKAAQCLIDKILSPVINAILKATGLSKLIDELEGRIMKLLGFEAIIDEINNVIGAEKLVEELNKIVSFKNDIVKMFESLDAGMKEFSPMRNADLGNNLKCMLAELLGAEFDPTRPSVIPDWPDEEIVDNSILRRSYVKRRMRFDWESRLRIRDSEQTFLTAINIIPLTELHTSLCVDIAIKADVVTEALANIEKRRLSLVSLVSTLEATLSLPDCFAVEMQTLRKCLDFMSRSIAFVSNISTLSSVKNNLVDMKKWTDCQIADCESVCDEICSLQNALASYHIYSQSVLTAIHSEKVADMAYSVNSYAESLQRVLDGFDLAKEHHPDAETVKRLGEVKERVLTNGNDVLQMLSDIENSANAVLQSYSVAHDGLNNTLKEFKKLSPEGYLLPEKTVNTIATVSGWLSQVEGILDPLELLIETLRENNHLETNGLDIVSLSKAMLHDFSQRTTNAIEKGDFWSLLETISPISLLRKQLHAFVTSSLVTDKNLLTELSLQLRNMTEQLSKGYEYKYDDEIVSNKFIGDNDVRTLTEVSFNIVKH